MDFIIPERPQEERHSRRLEPRVMVDGREALRDGCSVPTLRKDGEDILDEFRSSSSRPDADGWLAVVRDS